VTQIELAASSAVRKANSLLSALSAGDAALLAPHIQLVDLPRELRLERRGRAAEFVYFIERGVAVTIADDARGHGVEICMTGCEGLVGAGAVLGAKQSAYDVQMLTAGSARRIATVDLHEAMDASATLRRAILAYMHAFTLQVMREAQTNARMTLEARLARWLLMMHDRVEGDELHLTHDRLATMLGVRRAGVSVAAKKLERSGVILLHRGSILIQDRKQLEEASAGAYSAGDRIAIEAGG
jgi:CRP-like cAMP-binding protein